MNTLTYRAMSDMREFEDKKISTIPMKGRRMFRFPRSRIRDIRRAITCSTGLGQLFLLFVPCLAGTFFCFTMGIGLTSAQTLVPPPPPDIPPIISESYPSDLDSDKIEDSLFTFGEPEPGEEPIGEEPIGEEYIVDESAIVEVELIFNEPITQQQIDDFLLLGGEISYIYRGVSYGWNGRISFGHIADLPTIMGPTLVLVESLKATRRHMDVATRTGRVWEIWQPGFAGNSLGFDGDGNITIGIIDSGVDGTHRDLASRCVHWSDLSNDSVSPRDHSGHGSHVAAIAVGTGQASGKDAGTFYYTYAEPSSSPYHCPGNIALSSDCRISLEARWTDSTNTEGKLYLIAQGEGDPNDLVLIQENSSDFVSPIRMNTDISFEAGLLYFPYLSGLNEHDETGNAVITTSVTNYPGVGTHEFYKFRGVAPACKWAAVRDESDAGASVRGGIGAGIDDLRENRAAKKIKVVNISSGLGNKVTGLPSQSLTLRNKVNTAALKGILIVASAGNNANSGDDAGGEDHPLRKMADPARAGLALTVGSSNDRNALTAYSTYGFANPGNSEDYKPDMIAPGGSQYYTGIISVDTGSSDCYGRADLQADDYAVLQGTSMAAPFVSGCAALVIDAMQQKGKEWDFTSDRHPKYVKMILCATATETNQDREDGRYNPTLQRAQRGPKGFPVGKDPYEGYGIVNPDAAVEAVYLDFEWGKTYSSVELGNRPIDRRAWARRIPLIPEGEYKIELNNPPGGDFDMYIYSEEPDEATGTPVILYSATTSGRGTDEELQFTVAGGSITGLGGVEVEDDSAFFAILVVKRVSGSGSFSLRGDTLSGPGTTIEIHVQNSAGYGVPRVYLYTSGSSAFFSSGGEYNGSYYVEVPFNWSGRITPFRSGCSFEPSYFQFNNVMGRLNCAPIGYEGSYPPKFECQYTGTGPVYIYGSVRLHDNRGTSPLEDVNIEASNGIRTTTLENGYYILEVPYGWSGTITPKGNLLQYNWIYPTSKTFDSLRYDVEQDFTAGFEFDLPLSP